MLRAGRRSRGGRALLALAPALIALGAAWAIGAAGSSSASPEPSTPASSPPSGPGRNLNLILSTATHGELLPCGRCRVQAGGLARRAGLIRACRDTAGYVLAAEGGDLFRPGERDPQVDGFLVDLLARLDYSVFGVGEQDLRRGASYLKELVAKHPGLEWVSANVLDATTGKPIFAPYVTRRVGSTVVGFTSCLEPRLWEECAGGAPEVRIEPPEEVLAALIPAMRAKCDLVVGLLHMEYVPIRNLLTQMEGIDIAVAGHGLRVDRYPNRIKSARQVFFAGQRGRWINWSNVELSPEGPIPRAGRSVYMREHIKEDSTVVREVLAFLGTSEPPDDEPESETEAPSPSGSEPEEEILGEPEQEAGRPE